LLSRRVFPVALERLVDDFRATFPIRPVRFVREVLNANGMMKSPDRQRQYTIGPGKTHSAKSEAAGVNWLSEHQPIPTADNHTPRRWLPSPPER
jgi:hypothetical protein